MFSGYLQATKTNFLHYVHIESQNSPDSDPLVVWLNGGPGCSSLDGMLYENGPLLINESGTGFTENPHSWNTVANLLYIEAPIGVGFSYSTTGNYTMTDVMTAEQNANAIEYFLTTKFPNMASHDVYITGESYGGIYVPTLTLEIAQRSNTPIKIKGFAVGQRNHRFLF
eukprot:UN25299